VAGPVSFTVGDAESAATSLNVAVVSSSNPNLLPLAAIVLGGTGSNRTVTATPAGKASGFSLVTLSVTDTSGNMVQGSFGVVVNGINDLPTLDPLNNLTINEDSGVQSVNLTGINSGAANESQNLTVTATSSNPALIPNPTVNYISPNGNGTLSLSPAPDGSGIANITVSVDDGGGSNNIVSRTFVVTVNPINDAPTLDAISNITINEDSGVQAVNLTGITSGAANESQTLTVTATSSNPGLIATPVVNYTSPNGTGSLSLTAAANGSGTATITVSVNDGGASNNIVTRTFAVIVNAVNDPPTISGIADLIVIKNSNSGAIPFTVSDPETPASSLILTVASTNTILLPESVILLGGAGTNRTLSFVPTTNQVGRALITLTVSDGLLSTTTRFLVTVSDSPPPAPVLAIARTGPEQLEISFQTVSGRSYTLEFKDHLTDNWITSGTIAGDGTNRKYQDNAPAGSSRFYRVRAQ
jgi:hypothetical protein